MKIADFGLATYFKNKEQGLLSTKCGSREIIAPEVLANKKPKYEGPPVDVFALGVTLFILVTGMLPFQQTGDVFY